MNVITKKKNLLLNYMSKFKTDLFEFYDYLYFEFMKKL